jgi:hypothetical protein
MAVCSLGPAGALSYLCTAATVLEARCLWKSAFAEVYPLVQHVLALFVLSVCQLFSHSCAVFLDHVLL